MLKGLRHHPFIRRHNQQSHVHAMGACKHVLDKPLMPGHVNNPRNLPGREHYRGKAQINRHAPLLFLPKPVSIDPRKRLDQRGLAMINMPGSSYYGVPHRPCPLPSWPGPVQPGATPARASPTLQANASRSLWKSVLM